MNKIIVLQATIFILFCGIASSFGQTVSEEAKRHFDRGMAAVEMAKSPEDFKDAIKEFEQAIRLAPDWPDVYYNLGMVQEKAEKYSDAVTNLKQYLRLAPNASDVETVKSLINKLEYKLEYKKDQEEGIKKFYDIMTSGSYVRSWIGDCKMTGDEWLFNGPFGYKNSLFEFRNVTGKLEARNIAFKYEKENGIYHPELHPRIPREWEPVKVNGRLYEYTYLYYSDVSSGYVVRTDVEVKGEIISIDPPRVKEILKCSCTWGAPISGDSDSKGRPWSYNYRGTAECVFEWKLK
jgi:tetratricopeptide (TPR) repeat protein